MAIAERALFFNNDKQRNCLIALRNLKPTVTESVTVYPINNSLLESTQTKYEVVILELRPECAIRDTRSFFLVTIGYSLAQILRNWEAV